MTNAEQTIEAGKEIATYNESARNEKRNSAATLLAEAIALVGLTALRAAGTRPVIESNWFARGGGNREESATARMILLSAKEWGPNEYRDGLAEDTRYRGEYGGRQLARREDGRLLALVYSGGMFTTIEEGNVIVWQASIRSYASPEEAVNDGWTDVESYIRNLHRVLQEAAVAATDAGSAHRVAARTTDWAADSADARSESAAAGDEPDAQP